jgi:predicted amidophosphoribosyltransferase
LQCPKCRAKAEEGTRYCERCGAHVVQPERIVPTAKRDATGGPFLARKLMTLIRRIRDAVMEG